jgi:hypothetical protein
MIIVCLAAMAVALVHVRRAEIIARHQAHQLELKQVDQRRRMQDQQLTLSEMTSPAEVRKRVEDMSLGMVDKGIEAAEAKPKNRAAPPARSGHD